MFLDKLLMFKCKKLKLLSTYLLSNLSAEVYWPQAECGSVQVIIFLKARLQFNSINSVLFILLNGNMAL